MPKTCCFLGHRDIFISDEIPHNVKRIVEEQIANGAIYFLFGSKSKFNSICLEVVNGLKTKYPEIKLIYVRAEYPFISNDYKEYLLSSYDDTVYPDKLLDSGKAAYVERNQYMIDNSEVCIFCYSADYIPKDKKGNSNGLLLPKKRKSGTAIAFEYAVKKHKEIINVLGYK